MQVIAHNGPNWHPQALATHPLIPLIAVGVRTTVLLYQPDGTLTAELRVTGRGHVTALSFCTCNALTHLLAVGTSDGFVRVFDWETRRIFRKICEPVGGKGATVFDVRFLARFGNVLMVLRLGGSVEWFRYEGGVAISVGKVKLDVRRVLCAEHILTETEILLVGGVTKGKRGIVLAVDLRKMVVMNEVWSGKDYLFEITVRKEQGERGRQFLMALNQGIRGNVGIMQSIDGVRWTCIASSEANTAEVEESTKDESQYHCSVVWCGQDTLVSSEGDGGIVVWQVEDSRKLVEKVREQSAHVRQVFAMRELMGGDAQSFASISMDRTIAVWVLTSLEGKWKVHLKFRSLRTSGPVRSLALSQSQPRMNEKGCPVQKESILTYCSRDVITCVLLNASGDRCEMKGELTLFGSNDGKEKKERVSHLGSFPLNAEALSTDPKRSFDVATLGGVDGRLGLIKITDGRLEYIISKKRKRQSKSSDISLKQILLTRCNRAVSIANNGETVEWAFPGYEQLFEEEQSKSITSRTSYNVDRMAAKDSDIGATCLVPLESEDGFSILCGDGNGLVSVQSVRDNGPMSMVDTSLSRINCITYHKRHDLVAAADSCGSIATLRMLFSCADHSAVLTEPIIHGQHCPGETLGYLAWAPICGDESKDESCECSKEGAYLAAITTKGESIIFILDKDSRLAVRTRLKGHFGKVYSLVWESGHSLLTGGEDGSVRQWNVLRQPWPQKSK